MPELIYIPDILSSTIGSAIGAFIGFFGAIFLQKRNENNFRKKKMNLLIKNIKNEVNDISEVLRKYYIADPIDHRIQTPCWDVALASGNVLEFIDNPMFSNVMKFYSLIKYLNDERINLNKEENLKKIQEIVNNSSKIMETQENKDILGRNIKYFRFHRQLSQSALAEKSNISITFLSNIERGKMFPKVETLSRITESLDVAVYELFRTDLVPENNKEVINRFSVDITKNVNLALEEVIKQYIG